MSSIGDTAKPLVFVTVGTDHHPFDRVIRWVDGWLADGAGERVECVVQHGSSARPEIARGYRVLDHDELRMWLSEATAVVCHGGPTTITECRRLGRLPIVVPRSPALGEHVDGHQQRYCDRVAGDGILAAARTEEELREQLDRSLAEPEAFRVVTEGDDVAAAVERFARAVDELFTGPARTRRRRLRRSRPAGDLAET